MKTFVALSASFAAGSYALVSRADTCCFGLSASGGQSGQVGQLSDGQNRIGGNLPAGQYCIDSSGGITDGQGRGCFLTPPTEQFQCDVGQTPVSGFSVGCDGSVSFNGNTQFFACSATVNGEFNIYTSTEDKVDCVEISLSGDSCHSNCPTSTAAPAPVPTATSAPAPSSSSCPAGLSGTYEFPHLIIPIDSSSPDNAAGTSLFGEVSSTVSSIFNFDIPSSDSGKTCSLVFLFPEQSQLTTSSFTASGSGAVDFSELSSAAQSSTTFNNAPSVQTDFGVKTVTPGTSTVVATFDCPAGQTVGFEMKASDSTAIHYFQDFNPSPIGLYVTVC